MPPFVKFFQEQSEVKREHAKQFLRCLRKREGAICLPVIKKPDIDDWGNGMQALKSALQLEKLLTEVLKDLQSSALENDEADLIDFVKGFLDKQKTTIDLLKYFQKGIEESGQWKCLAKKQANPSDEET
nr:soma ferritin-like [Microcebus murinus]